MKEQGQKKLEVDLQKALQEVVKTIQKSCRGYTARATVARMKAARATMYRIFLSIQNRRKWEKQIKERKKVMRDAAKKI